jgi:hypothetical protein
MGGNMSSKYIFQSRSLLFSLSQTLISPPPSISCSLGLPKFLLLRGFYCRVSFPLNEFRFSNAPESGTFGLGEVHECKTLGGRGCTRNISA